MRTLLSYCCLWLVSMAFMLPVRAENPQSAAVAPSHAPFYLWWEAEKPDTYTHATIERFPASSPEGQVLSESARLTPATGSTPAMSATYTVVIPHDATCDLWVRKFWKHGPFNWRFGTNAWRTCGRDIALHDDTYIRLHNGANWVFLGREHLPVGTQRLEIVSIDNAGWFDCFLLTDGPFMPAGRLKPGEKSGAAQQGFFAWEPDPDAFNASPIDLRYLNEEFAGIHGYVRREGGRFVLGDGTPVSFWLSQAGDLINMEPPMVDLHARRLAKYGVNMARLFFLDLFATWRRGDMITFSQKLDRVHYVVAALKKQGIYTYFGHLYWDTHVHALNDNDLPGLTQGQPATAALFFNQPLQKKYLAWIAAVMTPVNPYTGLSLAEDPAVAIIEVQNESNALFWTMDPNRLPAHTVMLMQKAFAQFAIRKHGSLKDALQYWRDTVNGDDVNEQRAGILAIWNLTGQGPAVHAKRAADQREFLARSQFDLYAKMKQAFHDLGIRTLVAGSNWKTADPSILGPLEYFSYTAVDMICKNEYFSPKSIKNERFHAVDVGDRFVSLSAMRAPEMAGVLMTAQPHDYPFLITENNWDNPSEYRAEFPFLVATYGRMAGIDAWNFFGYDTPLWDASMGVWNVNSPCVMGQFPATALMYRRGDVTEGPPAVCEEVKLQNLFDGKPLALPEIQYKDAVWQRTLGGDPKVAFQSTLDPKAFFAGPVRIAFSESRANVKTADLGRLINTRARVIHNTNNQLTWNYGKGYVLVNTPRSQGACGFLQDAGRLRLPDISIQSRNRYGSIVAISLDGKPLAESGTILIQAGTQDQPFGYATKPIDEQGGVEVVSKGGYPFMVRTVDATVTVRGKAGNRVTVLDPNGYPRDSNIVTNHVDGNLILTLPSDALYTVISN